MKFIGWKECELADEGEYLSDDTIQDTPEGKNIHNMIVFYVYTWRIINVNLSVQSW